MTAISYVREELARGVAYVILPVSLAQELVMDEPRTSFIYETLLGHMKYHNIKQWLLDGAEKEDARTIGNAVRNIPERRLIRRLARALSKDIT